MDEMERAKVWLDGFIKVAADRGITEPEDIKMLLRVVQRQKLATAHPRQYAEGVKEAMEKVGYLPGLDPTGSEYKYLPNYLALGAPLAMRGGARRVKSRVSAFRRDRPQHWLSRFLLSRDIRKNERLSNIREQTSMDEERLSDSKLAPQQRAVRLAQREAAQDNLRLGMQRRESARLHKQRMMTNAQEYKQRIARREQYRKHFPRPKSSPQSGYGFFLGGHPPR